VYTPGMHKLRAALDRVETRIMYEHQLQIYRARGHAEVAIRRAYLARSPARVVQRMNATTARVTTNEIAGES
jgi:hypothetical protein